MSPESATPAAGTHQAVRASMSVSAEKTASGVEVKAFVVRKSSVVVAVVMAGSFLKHSFVQVFTCRIGTRYSVVKGPSGRPSPASTWRTGATDAVAHRCHRRRTVGHGGGAAASRSSSRRLVSGPPKYEPGRPSARITRWQGTTSGSGLVAHAVPTARAAPGWWMAEATRP